MHIRPINLEKDFPVLKTWWEAYSEVPPTRDMLPIDTTFVVETKDGEPVASLTLELTNISGYARMENFVSSPDFYRDLKRPYITALVDYTEKKAKELGYKRIACMSNKPSLIKRYMAYGYYPTLTGVCTLVKEIA